MLLQLLLTCLYSYSSSFLYSGVGSITNLQSCTVRQDKWLLFVQCTLIDKICQTNIIVLGEKARITSLSFDQSIVDFVCIPLTPFKSGKSNDMWYLLVLTLL